MCKIMGKEFQQYLPIVMGPVLKAASLKPEVALLDSKHLHTIVKWKKTPQLNSVNHEVLCIVNIPNPKFVEWRARFPL